MKIDILLPYFNRPQIVKNALRSILYQDHSDYEVLFHDDDSPIAGEPIARSILPDRVKYYRSKYSSVEKKLAMGGMLGAVFNEMLDRSTADVVIFLCDDDALMPSYLRNLSEYFTNNDSQLAYSHVQLFDPENETLEQAIAKPVVPSVFNKHSKPVNSKNVHDASQVAWRLEAMRKAGIRFQFPLEKNHDANLYDQLNRGYGPTPFTGFIGQLKGIWQGQQGNVGWERAQQKAP